MGQSLHKKNRHSPVITASELTQYTYCPMAWYLKKSGYEPVSLYLEQGKKNHESLGLTLDIVHSSTKKVYCYVAVGSLLLIFCFMILFFM